MSELTESATWSEICAQPGIWGDWAGDLAGRAAEIRAWVEERGFEDIVFAGAGTSAYIGEIVCRSSLETPRLRAIPTTDIVADPLDCLKDDAKLLVVQFGRSGNSSESIGTLDVLDAHFPKAARLNITCNPDGALATRASKGTGEQRVIQLPDATHDTGFAMTSSFSTMLLTALACFAPERDVRAALKALAARAEGLISVFGAQTPPRPDRAVFLGSGALKGAAREAALKVLELTAGRTVSSWDSTLGFRHGPKSVITGPDLVVIGIHPNPHTARYDRDVASEIRRQFPAARVVTLGGPDEGHDIRGTGDAQWDAVLFVLAAQIWAAKWSAALDLNVDNPFVDSGNLSRVVSGVTLYPLEA